MQDDSAVQMSRLIEINGMRFMFAVYYETRIDLSCYFHLIAKSISFHKKLTFMV
jgi:hypothetical protein